MPKTIVSHTPGPWDLQELPLGNDGEQEPTFRISADPTLFLHVTACSDGYQPDQNRANAHLIVASPDLLAMCEAVLPYLEECQPPPSHEGSCNPEAGCDMGCMAAADWAGTIHRLRTVIAKAKGEPR